MSREDTRDAASADVAYDSAYDSPAEKHQKDYDYWFHDPERRARFDPKSVTGCPVDPALLSVRCTRHDGHDGWHGIHAAGFVAGA